MSEEGIFFLQVLRTEEGRRKLSAIINDSDLESEE